ncbi:hypothetical protein HORIV_62510 [Vreelandella olivaria]|uniref:Peptidase M20 dimerisation domain-containing protein n=1 Tax=Vreelandella olivaria TaxID=390919 RepID=A0ABM7GSM3_9GAMM|nr:hypothetical protein HORIV_62510 [Halomonas olivaria]
MVIGGLGQKWFDLTLTGLEAHAGPTPMNLRRDAMMGAAEVTQALNRIAFDHQPHGRGTVGCMTLHPGSRNVIPGQVKMTLDMRHWEPEALIAMGQSVAAAVEEICQRHGLTYELTPPRILHLSTSTKHVLMQCVRGPRNSISRIWISSAVPVTMRCLWAALPPPR